jgi:hypothetical protein
MRRRPVEGKVQCSDEGQPGGRIGRSELYAVDHGSVLVADERVADAFTAPGDPVERFMYGWSVLHCLPLGRRGRRTGSDTIALYEKLRTSRPARSFGTSSDRAAAGSRLLDGYGRADRGRLTEWQL